MFVNFDRAWVLAAAWLPLAWMFWEWPRTQRRAGLVLKVLCFVAILLALAEPRLTTDETKVAVAVLVDTSASVSANDLQRASERAAAISAAKGRHSVTIIPFARDTRAVQRSEQQPWRLQQTAGEAGRATDLEAAVRDAIASVPGGMVPRVVLMSDGKENKGSIARAAWQARQLQIPIDTYALSGRAKPALRLESISLPSLAFTGEQFAIDLVVSAPQAGDAQIELAAEGRVLGKSTAHLEAGQNPVSVHASLNTPGALDLSIAVRSVNSGEIRFDQAILLRRPRILYITSDTAAQDTHLSAILQAAQFEVNRIEDLSKANIRLSDYQLLIFNNWDLDSVPAASKADVERYVKQGGGLLVIGGERNLYTEGVTKEDPLSKALPATVAPPRSPEGTAVVLIVDKSSSMEGRKMELARLAAIGVVENLRPIDLVGVLIFDNTFEWAVPIRKAEDKTLIKRLISGITPDGGTQIPPALAEAYKRIQPVNATYKHIVLLTDGISEEGDANEVSRDAQTKRVTISSVGLGQDVNRNFLERIATNAGGKAYFLTDPAALEQILIKDVMEHTGSTAVEKPLAPVVTKNAEILNGVGAESAPALKGYIRFEAKPSADTILKIDRDPLLARWQYGLGRSAVFASDAKARWAADWVAWKGFDKFWTNVARDLLPHSQAGEAAVDYDSANGDLVVDYRLGTGVEEPAQIPGIYVFGPGGFQQPVEVKKVAAGTFRGRVQIGQRQGLFRVRPVEESRAFPEAGLYRPETELADYGSNELLLKQVAAFTGGRFEPQPADVFEAGRRSIPTVISLWPGLLGIAVILSLVELVMRKWKGVVAGRAA
jgi:Ca-activated chloride channel family protein